LTSSHRSDIKAKTLSGGTYGTHQESEITQSKHEKDRYQKDKCQKDEEESEQEACKKDGA
jgi:hypothetical protein